MKLASTSSSKQINTSFDQFYLKNYAWLYGWLCKKLQNSAKAEDVLQDTFTKILQLQRLPYIQEPKAYLTTTANRIIIDQARKEKIEQIYLEYLLEQQDTIDSYSPEHCLMAIDILNHIAAILNGLEQRSRKVFLLHHLDGLSQVEIAEILQISRKTVKADLVKSMLYCHKHFKNDILLNKL